MKANITTVPEDMFKFSPEYIKFIIIIIIIKSSGLSAFGFGLIPCPLLATVFHFYGEHELPFTDVRSKC